MQIVFFATPDFAIPCLQQLISHPAMNVLAVVTQPDKPVGRKQKLTPPPVKTVASEHCIPVFQPGKLSSDEELIDKLRTFNPDVLVTVAYGQILKQNVLDIPKLGVVNLHASVLPAYRGPAPINWMLINGEEELGVSTMFSDKGVDTGPAIDTITMISNLNENSVSLTERMALVGADLLLESLLKLDDALKTRTDRDYLAIKNQFSKEQEGYEELDVSKKLAPFMTKDLGRIDFSAEEIYYSSPNPRQDFFKYTKTNSAKNIHNLVRGTYPWPGSFFMYKDEKISIIETEIPFVKGFLEDAHEKKNYQAGEIVKIDHKIGYIWIQTQDGVLQINKLKPAGKKEMKASDCLNGLRLKDGDSLV